MPSLREFLIAWTRVAALSFGGPAGQIAVMHRIVVEEKGWISEHRFLHALNYCMLLPGPEAQQLATYIGWLLRGKTGGFIAGGLFILPGFLSILALSFVYALYRELPHVEAIFFGLKSAVLAIVLNAVFRIGKKALKTPFALALAAASFAALFLFAIPFPIVILAAALAGLLAARLKPAWLPDVSHGEPANPHQTPAAPVTWQRSLRVLAVGAVCWLGPILACVVWLGPKHPIAQQGLFFSKAAMVTFGGAYAVLSYVGQEAVETQALLEPGEMLDGLGMAETTPGPLIQVVQFVGFMGAYRDPAPFHPLAAATLASLVTTWATFAPCFLWIFLGAPYVEKLLGNRAANAALSSITAAVVGVILNLALWFGLHALFHTVAEIPLGPLHLLLPNPATAKPLAIAIAALSLFALLKLKWNILPTLALAIALGLLLLAL